MKAKDLKLGDICYRPGTATIKSLKVVRLGFDPDGDIRITFHDDSLYDKGRKVQPDAEAIIMEHEWMPNIYFSLEAAKTRQRRMREKKIDDAKKALEKAAQRYAYTYAKYHDAPASEPSTV